MNHILSKVKELLNVNSQNSDYCPFTVFDFDNSIIHNDIQRAFIAYICENDLLKNNSLLHEYSITSDQKSYSRYAFLKLQSLLKDESRYDEAMQYANRMLTGFTVDEVKKLVKDVIEFEGTEVTSRELFGVKIPKGIVLDKLAYELKMALEDMNLPVWFVSASSQPIIAGIIEYFGWSNNYIGVRSQIEKGMITDQVLYPYSVKEGKVDCIKELIHPKCRPILALGDSTGDIPMLEYSEISIVIKNNSDLLNYAKKKNWFVLS